MLTRTVPGGGSRHRRQTGKRSDQPTRLVEGQCVLGWREPLGELDIASSDRLRQQQLSTDNSKISTGLSLQLPARGSQLFGLLPRGPFSGERALSARRPWGALASLVVCRCRVPVLGRRWRGVFAAAGWWVGWVGLGGVSVSGP
jgi:hypothetical protein